MTIYEVVTPALAMLGKSDADADILEHRTYAIEILKMWVFSSKRIYELFAAANSLPTAKFEGYTVNDDFAYGEDFAPAACNYIAMIMSPETERFRQVYDAAMKDLRARCGAESSPVVNKHPI